MTLTDRIAKKNKRLEGMIDARNKSLRLRKNPKLKKGFIYLMNQVETDFYKIGMTRNLRSRLEAIQISNPITIEILFSKEVEDPIPSERLLHLKYKDNALGHEWFKFNKDELELVRIDFK